MPPLQSQASTSMVDTRTLCKTTLRNILLGRDQLITQGSTVGECDQYTSMSVFLVPLYSQGLTTALRSVSWCLSIGSDFNSMFFLM